jgi:Na+/H+-dicarboxylate symporter
MTIGLTIMNVFEPGLSWSGHLQALASQLPPMANGTPLKPTPQGVTLNPLANISGYIPENIMEPFLKNNIISVILMAVFVGCAIRSVKKHTYNTEKSAIHIVETTISACYQVLLIMLAWIINVIPFAICGVVAQVVGKSGLGVFALLSIFLVTLLGGLLLHAFVYYPLMAHTVGRVPIRRYVGQGADAILTGFSTNSSLATVPVTLLCLTEKIGVSERSARLAALIGTNLNNDGVVLYEAMTAIFLAQALGMNLDMSQQLLIIAASVMVGIGVAGIPEAGLVALPLVLSTIGLETNFIAAVIPLIATIDWIIARCRSVVNVMSDMLVAILLDRFDGKTKQPIDSVFK